MFLNLQSIVRWVRKRNRIRLIRRRLSRDPTALVALPLPTKLDLPVGESETVLPKQIALATSGTPEVSIIIPAYGQVEVTLRCLASLHHHPPECAYEVIVVEDASGDAGADRVGEVPGVRFIANTQNQGFLRTCNAAAKLARAPYLLLLNNDTQVLPGAVDALRNTFATWPRAGLVGAKLVYPDGRLQEAGGIIWRDGSARNHGRGGHPGAAAYNYLREVDYISGAAIMVEAALWRHLGGFDERFCPAYCEDSDLAMQVRQAGRQVLYQPASVVVHLEGVSNGTDLNAGVKQYQVVNAKTFFDKWQSVLAREHLPNEAANVYMAADRAQLRRTVLVTNDAVVQPDVDAGSRTIAQSLDALLALGVAVKFWPDNPAEPEPYTSTLRARGVDVVAGLERPAFEQWVRAVGSHIDCAFMHRPDATARMLPMLRKHSPARIVYFGHDLHFKRLAAQALLQGDAHLHAAADALHEVETALWRSADMSVYPSQDEVDVVRAQCPRAQACAVQAYCFDEVVPPGPAAAGKTLLFVAGFGHPPNVDAARWLALELMPLVWAVEPEAQVLLVGSRPTPEVRALTTRRVTVTGWVSDAELHALYRSSRVAVVPLRFGAGVKHKVVEALAQGLPLVTTPIGAQGLPGLEHACLVAEDAPTLARHLVMLLRDDVRWLSLAQTGTAYVQTHFSRQHLQQQMAELLGPLR